MTIQKIQIPNIPKKSEISEFRNRLLSWFKINKRSFPWRKPSASKYQLIISEFFLQRTRAETVSKFFPEFIRKYPSWKKLISASKDDLENYLKPLGLWKHRSSSIYALAEVMAKNNGRFPRNRNEIEALPGIGQYNANAIQLFCHNVPKPLLDVNMARVLERIFGPRKMADIRYDPYLQQLAQEIVNCDKAIELNWAIIDFAAIVCLLRNPRCNLCPMEEMCFWNKEMKITNSLPNE